MRALAPAAELLRQMVQHRRLIRELVRRDIRARFAGARFGLLWSLINPAVQLAAYSVIFGHIYGTGGRPRSAVVAALFCGLWPWWAFQEASLRATGALVEQASLLRRLPIPATLPIVASTIAAIAVQMLGFCLFLLVFVAFGVLDPGWSWWALPLVGALHAAMAIGLGLVLAPLYLVARDVMQVVILGLTVGFFASPVLYELGDLPETLQLLACANPLIGVLGLFRTVVLGASAPPVLAIVWLLIAIGLSWTIGARLVGKIEGRIDEYS